jgi:hypothetical protein
LRWSLKPTARKSSWLQKLAEEEGRSFKTLDDRPELHKDLRWIWEAFVYLDRRRPPGFSAPCAIPPSEIKAYCDLLSVWGSEEREDLLRFIAVLDDEFLADASEKRKREEAKNKNKGKKTPPKR